MNQENAGCFACRQDVEYTPIRYGDPISDLNMVWDSMDYIQKGLVVAVPLLVLAFIFPKVIKRFR